MPTENPPPPANGGDNPPPPANPPAPPAESHLPAGVVVRPHHDATERRGVVVAPFDAELFGHWWHEGPRFLEQVFRTLHQDPGAAARTVSEHLAWAPPDKVVSLPEGSWGEGGDHRVWMNDALRWTWEASFRAEDRFLALHDSLPWRHDGHVAEALRAAARELLLLQASDWQFVIHTKGAVDYGYRRFCEHLGRFDRACRVADRRARGVPDAGGASGAAAAAQADHDGSARMIEYLREELNVREGLVCVRVVPGFCVFFLPQTSRSLAPI